jgi:hypothetical protein
MEVWYDDRLLGISEDLDFLTGGSTPVQFVLSIKPDNTISIWLNDETEHVVFKDLPGYESMAGEFGLGARFSANSDGYLWIDDLSIEAAYEPPQLPPELSVKRLRDGSLRLHLEGNSGHHYYIESSTDLIEWNLWQEITVPSGLTEADLNPVEMTGSNAQFFRARSD